MSAAANAQSVSNSATIYIDAILLLTGFSWQLFNTYYSYTIAQKQKSTYNAVASYCQGMYSLVFVFQGLQAWAILETGGYPLYLISGLLPTSDPYYKLVLNIGRVEACIFFTSTFICRILLYTFCM